MFDDLQNVDLTVTLLRACLLSGYCMQMRGLSPFPVYLNSRSPIDYLFLAYCDYTVYQVLSMGGSRIRTARLMSCTGKLIASLYNASGSAQQDLANLVLWSAILDGG